MAAHGDPGGLAAGQLPQYPYGYGLTYADKDHAAPLPEVSGVIVGDASDDVFFRRGKPTGAMQLRLRDTGGEARLVASVPATSPAGGITITAIDYKAQEGCPRYPLAGQRRHAVDWLGHLN